MSITDILIRSMGGYIFVLPIVIIYFICLCKLEKKQSISHIIISSIFCYYLIGILTMTGIHAFKTFSPNIVLVPFLDMISGSIDTILNIILFIPLGFFLPLLYKKYNNMGKVALNGFILSIFIELIQMFGMGSTDINDLITNTIGTCLGYVIYKLIRKFILKWDSKVKATNIKDYIEVLFFITISVLIMVTIQPWVMHTFFHLG